MKKKLMVFGVSLFLTACAPIEEPTEELPEETVETERRDATETVMATELSIPWSIEKSGNIFYISEREGAVVKVENGEVERQAVHLEEELSTVPEAGLLGFVFNPNVDGDEEAFAYYTYEGENGPTNRIVRLVFEENQWVEQSVLLDDIPSGNIHHGGRLAIGSDEKLYATTGDAAVPELSQDIDSLAGNILRMNLDGTIPEDNPFSDSYVYSYGHRNSQGITWLEDGTMYSSEHGNQANDEINRIESGQNYGWPVIEGYDEEENLTAPIFTSGADTTWAPSGMAAHENTLYVAGLRGNAVYTFDLEAEEFEEVLTEYGRIRDIYIEDDFLYFITNNTDGRGEPMEEDDRLIRIELEELN